MTQISITFIGRPGDLKSKLAEKIIKEHDGKFLGAGTFLATSERDIDADIPAERLADCKTVLEAQKFKVEVKEQ